MRKFGVVIEDWPFVIVLGLAGFFVTYFLNLKLFGFPLPFFGLLGSTSAGVAFFNWTRRGKRLGFLQHKIADFLTAGHERRGWLPADLAGGVPPRADYIIPAKRKTSK